jgi:aryl-alcohol dehydrogenase-like predicted oxidoreductase
MPHVGARIDVPDESPKKPIKLPDRPGGQVDASLRADLSRFGHLESDQASPGDSRPIRSSHRLKDSTDYRQLAQSGMRVSALALGTLTFGGGGEYAATGATDLAGARRQLDMCRDAGVNLIDTADEYSCGLAVELVGKAIRGQRDRWLIATKVRCAMGGGPNDEGLSRHHLIEGCEAWLRRLHTNHIDLYQVHEWDGMTPREETLAALQALIDSGKVRYVGGSNYAAWQLMKALWIAERARLPSFVSQQIYHPLQERSVEYGLVPLAVDQGLGMLVWNPLSGGWLSGKYRRDRTAPEGSRQLTGWDVPPVCDEERLYDTVDLLAAVAERHGVSAAHVALAWPLTRPTVSSVLIGARTDEQLAGNLEAADLVLSADELARLEQVSRPNLLYPYWHRPMTAS